MNPDDHRVKSEIVRVKFVSLDMILLGLVNWCLWTLYKCKLKKGIFLAVLLMVVLFFFCSSGEAKRVQREASSVYGSK